MHYSTLSGTQVLLGRELSKHMPLKPVARHLWLFLYGTNINGSVSSTGTG